MRLSSWPPSRPARWPKHMLEAVVVALTTPVLVGIYKDGRRIEVLTSPLQSSEALPALFDDILSRYQLGRIVYANGPGSFMAIKVAYIFLKTLSIVKEIPLQAADAFYFNGNRPVKAVGKLYFVKTSSTIKTEKFDAPVSAEFKLPSCIDNNDFTDASLPFYGIGAVG